ncbi:toll/interleukin-1 receptor domain-containing protein [Smaragdicoccus niigatensis]|uniref:toll/interleukin-1 receptor domain-containing protein n=1 Tax=Smaragdicoccus niigatensis TaxID=359359 RepID=UPI000477CB83|nr:toll/interleukin-1 receptor domain-containing protein [Smaragdicoccus niigatensis]
MTWLRFGRRLPSIGFGAFISYSGERDRALIAKLQNGIEKLAKRWYRPPVMKVFVDKTSIGAGPKLWGRIEGGLRQSTWLILMASPEAAQSWWVDREVSWWIQNRPLDNLIIVNTAGVLRWDREIGDFSSDSNAIPPSLRGKFADEPVWVSVPRSDHGPNVDAAVLSIAAAVRQMPVHELSSKAYIEHRRTLRWAGGALVGLSVLLVGALVATVVAVIQKGHADTQSRISLARQLAATSVTELSTNPRAAMLLAVSAYKIDPNPQTLAALMRVNTANPYLVRYLDAGGRIVQLVGSSDGTAIVAGLADGRVMRWHIGDPAPRTLLKLPDAVTSLAVSADASVVAAAGRTSVFLWRSGVPTANLPALHGDRISAVAVSPSGEFVAINSCCTSRTNGTVEVLDTSQKTPEAQFSYSSEDMNSGHLVATDHDLLSFGTGGRWERRQISDGTVIEAGSLGLGGHQMVSLPSGNGQFVAATLGSTTTQVWQMRGLNLPDGYRWDLEAQVPTRGTFTSVVLSSDGTTVAIANNGSIFVAPVVARDKEKTLSMSATEQSVEVSGAEKVTSGLLSFLGDNHHLVSATGNLVALWDLDQVDRLAHAATIGFSSTTCWACGPALVSVAPDSKRIAIFGETPAAVEPLPSAVDSPQLKTNVPGQAMWRKNGRLLIAATKPTRAATGIEENQLLIVPGTRDPVAAALAPDKSTAIVVGADGVIFVYDSDTGEIRETIPKPSLPADEASQVLYTDADVSSAADLVAIVSKPFSSSVIAGSVQIYDLAKHQVVGEIAGEDVVYARFAGPFLLIQRASGKLEVWDKRGSSLVRVIAGDESYFRAPVADEQGNLVVRRRDENTLDIFDLRTATLLGTLPAVRDSVLTGPAFSPDGRLLVNDVARLAGTNDLVVTREMDPNVWLAKACAAAGTDLSAEEWRVLTGIAPDGIPTCR